MELLKALVHLNYNKTYSFTAHSQIVAWAFIYLSGRDFKLCLFAAVHKHVTMELIPSLLCQPFHFTFFSRLLTLKVLLLSLSVVTLTVKNTDLFCGCSRFLFSVKRHTDTTSKQNTEKLAGEHSRAVSSCTETDISLKSWWSRHQ